MKVGKAGGKPVALATVNLPSGLASDGVNVYWTDYLEETIKRVPITGGEPATVGDCEKPGSGGLAVDSTSVYCTSAEGKVLRFARSNGAVTTIANVENAAFDQILIDERSVYALSVIQGIYRIDKRGESAVRLVPLDRVSANFAIDEQNLYWSNYDEGTVNRRRK